MVFIMALCNHLCETKIMMIMIYTDKGKGSHWSCQFQRERDACQEIGQAEVCWCLGHQESPKQQNEVCTRHHCVISKPHPTACRDELCSLQPTWIVCCVWRKPWSILNLSVTEDRRRGLIHIEDTAFEYFIEAKSLRMQHLNENKMKQLK